MSGLDPCGGGATGDVERDDQQRLLGSKRRLEGWEDVRHDGELLIGDEHTRLDERAALRVVVLDEVLVDPSDLPS